MTAQPPQLRIAFCVPSLGLQEGQGRADLELLRCVAAAGHAVDVFTSSAPDEARALPGVRIRKIPRLRAWQLGNLLIMLAWTTAILRRRRYDIVHADAGMIARRVDTMTCHTISARWFDLPPAIWREPGFRGAHATLAGRFKAWLEVRQYRNARIVFANSDATGRDLVARGVAPESITVVPFGVDASRYHPPQPSERAAARIALGVPHDAFGVCFVGPHGPRKGLPVLIDALRGSDAHLIAAGDHRGAGTLGHAATAGVTLTAPGKLADVRTAYWAADLFVYPTRYDAFGMAVLEAMACALPVIVSPEAGAAQLCAGGAGLVLPEVSAEAISTAVSALRGDPARREALSRAARAVAEGRDWDTAGQTLLDAFNYLGP